MREKGKAMNDNEREDRALEALIVYALRSLEDDPDCSDLPELSQADVIALDALGPDFVERLIKKANEDADSP